MANSVNPDQIAPAPSGWLGPRHIIFHHYSSGKIQHFSYALHASTRNNIKNKKKIFDSTDRTNLVI